jgi:hypothetical protein
MTGTSTGRLMLAVLGGLADVERDLIRTRTAEGRSRQVVFVYIDRRWLPHLVQANGFRAFPYALLRAVSGFPESELQTALGRLVASELVFQRGMPPDAVYNTRKRPWRHVFIWTATTVHRLSVLRLRFDGVARASFFYSIKKEGDSRIRGLSAAKPGWQGSTFGAF